MKAELEKITHEVRLLNAGLEDEVERRTEALRQTLHELEKSRHELQVALARERELGELKSRFVTMASHEFKTPLSLIIGPLNDLINNNITEENRNFCFNVISRNTKRFSTYGVLIAISADLFAFTKYHHMLPWQCAHCTLPV